MVNLLLVNESLGETGADIIITQPLQMRVFFFDIFCLESGDIISNINTAHMPSGVRILYFKKV